MLLRVKTAAILALDVSRSACELSQADGGPVSSPTMAPPKTETPELRGQSFAPNRSGALTGAVTGAWPRQAA